ncbi:MAG: 2-amino-3,7-dideoxy-D-threo-hept-6-ulosonate synthase [Pseudodesulfovibrio sp.]|uniref:2-amino-3,7-dideoxy-D-threo-hept-6-ulosonate synthase n=1 Tax=Pseudodesulfovibrio aespoeensis (strain ATCC 700646 / DSM 10631 / Aspo-2) TaxID=643562 RepID=E6VRK9_PSEA9|nr:MULTISPECIES: 2-amino-3,7-dideoxy-D-threo-hept-6-ulosonate synthase [Pseudodesulfovibrio]MBU4191866.1 2-amino-3,7-dideoxy-D-threo-hept-6-ulosonate synthase [Pseudomonadota bacterium]ADU63046.1 predicted phospho-2-dehydro-3-deoxyheptonate aldolase [Pseudodesulfovibrio aespoeensis Aspo-2]MBU4377911.1 2-amino-3,7-dideoxy-D-threo-hept-6-ulosonate synthase [Pseudomonadota bacterium]MBU4475849.1 2-amino-3,7-dideoxy-D-threo-hept-6-ulosonate synthase [Pseudomonadota bacterium]MBU4516687.1 2-amino-3
MHLGKAIRMERIMNRNNGRTIVVPLDHGVTVGPIYGLVDLRETVNLVAEGGANAMLMHKGIPRCSHRAGGKDIGLIIHLSASTTLSPFPNAKTIVGTVTDAIKLGADAVSVHVNLGDEAEPQMLADLGRLCSEANEWGMPVLAMMYARGPKITNEYDPDVVSHCARVGVELGADIVKVNYTGDIDSFARVVDGCCVPVVIAGGPKLESERDLVQMVHDSIRAGGSGLSVGRNIFQHESPAKIVAALHKVVHEDWDVDAAMALL